MTTLNARVVRPAGVSSFTARLAAPENANAGAIQRFLEPAVTVGAVGLLVLAFGERES